MKKAIITELKDITLLTIRIILTTLLILWALDKIEQRKTKGQIESLTFSALQEV